MTRILIVASDTALRHSLEFALESEGYEVACADTPRAAARAEAEVTVIDHHALDANLSESVAFMASHEPVVLLANAKAHALSPYAFRTVMKPMLGDSLSSAIHDAIDTRATH